jgi:hypothetical protein
MKASVITIAAVTILFFSCNKENVPISSGTSTDNLLKRPSATPGLITTQALMRVGSVDNIISDATIQLLDKNSKRVLGTLTFQAPGDPYPGYWRITVDDISKTYFLRCIPPAEYQGRLIFSCLTAQYGVGTINSTDFSITPSDWIQFNNPSLTAWLNGIDMQAYPRQFYIATQ